MPVLGHASQTNIVNDLKRIAEQLVAKHGKPTAIAVVSAHFEEASMMVGGAEAPAMIYDYGGFPAASYSLKYSAKGDVNLARRMQRLLTEAGIKSTVDEKRGFDHGVFVPLMLMFPAADIPVVPVSVLHSQNPSEHMAVGKALQPLRDEGVLIIGSGSSTHNFAYADFKAVSGGVKNFVGEAFNAQLASVLGDTQLNPLARMETLSGFLSFEKAVEAQVSGKAEHLMPLFTVVGAAGGSAATHSSRTTTFNQVQTSYVFDS
jgi:aromatic ring-opening dioxygenase catalytic subunit (LigB family)